MNRLLRAVAQVPVEVVANTTPSSDDTLPIMGHRLHIVYHLMAARIALRWAPRTAVGAVAYDQAMVAMFGERPLGAFGIVVSAAVVAGSAVRPALEYLSAADHYAQVVELGGAHTRVEGNPAPDITPPSQG